MSLDSYAALKSEIGDWLDRDDIDTQIDTFIDLAEARHKREIRIREMLARQQASIDAQYEVLPSGFLQMRELRLLTTPVTTLEPVSPQEMTRRRSRRWITQTGRPCAFTVHKEIEFDVTPDQTYTAEMVFWQELTPLSDSNTTNALLTRASDAYLFGALVASGPFLEQEERLPTWEATYVAARDDINKMDRNVSGRLVSRVAGATP